tara:strand:- start:267 stop:2270 length:2004 start_codon:yes stop_codon:yes gene_type:complete
MTDEIIIPSENSPINKKIIISEEVLDRDAKQLLQGSGSNEIFILFVNYITSQLAKENTEQMNISKQKILELTFRNKFKEQDNIDYRYSESKYKKYLEHFVKEIENSILYATDGFSLISPLDATKKDKKNKKLQINTSPKSDSFQFKNRVGDSVFFNKELKRGEEGDTNKTVREIIDSRVSQYPIKPPNTKEKTGWFLSKFDTNTSLFLEDPFLKEIKKKKNEMLSVETNEKEITITINTYKYFDHILKESGYKGLLPLTEKKTINNRIPHDVEGSFHITYLPDKKISYKKGDGLKLRNQIRTPDMSLDGTVYSGGTFSVKQEYKHNKEEVEELRTDIKATIDESDTQKAYLKGAFLKEIFGKENTNSSPKVDTLSSRTDLKGVMDTLFVPKDREITIGIYEATYTIESIDPKILNDKNKFYNFITTNTIDDKKSTKRKVERMYKEKIANLRILLKDVETNTLEGFINGGSFPIKFFEELLEELNPQNKGMKLILDSIKNKENLPIEVGDTPDDIESRLSSDDVENNSIIEENLSEEDQQLFDKNPNINSRYYQLLQTAINDFKTAAKKEIESYKSLDLNANQSKNITIPILKGTDKGAKFTELAILDATGGRRGGITSSQTNIKGRITEAGTKLADTKTKEVKEGNTISLIKRAFNKLDRFVSLIGS